MLRLGLVSNMGVWACMLLCRSSRSAGVWLDMNILSSVVVVIVSSHLHPVSSYSVLVWFTQARQPDTARPLSGALQVKMCLVINKVDRLVLETRLTPTEAYDRLKVLCELQCESRFALLCADLNPSRWKLTHMLSQDAHRLAHMLLHVAESLAQMLWYAGAMCPFCKLDRVAARAGDRGARQHGRQRVQQRGVHQQRRRGAGRRGRPRRRRELAVRQTRLGPG